MLLFTYASVLCYHSRTSRSRTELSAPESDDIVSQELAYHAFVDCDLHHHYHYGRHLRHHGDDVHYHQHQQLQTDRQSSVSDAQRRCRSQCGATIGETQYDLKHGAANSDGEKATQLGLTGHQYEAPHSVQLVYCQTPTPATLTACRQHSHGPPVA